MNWKVVVGVSMLCITVMTGCTEKKMQSSKSNETVKKKVEVSKKDKEKEETVTEQGTLEDSSEEDTEEQKYKLQKIDISAKEQRRIEKRLTDVIEKCRGIYHGQTESVDTGQDGAENLASTELSEEIVHQLVDTVAEDGTAVTCGEYDYNMQNYEQVKTAVTKAEKGENSKTTFYEINTSGNFIYNHLDFKKKKLYLTTATAYLDENDGIILQQMEKIRVYDWKYTKKGWLIWEKAKSKNQEMDMHVLYRVEPLSDMCRQMTNAYITPISYFCNNLFLTDWDEDSMDQLEFNDLYDFLYQMKYGKKLDEEAYKDGIPKSEFETVVQTYFDISTDQLEQYARYDAEKGVYPWEAIGPWNRVQQFQPFPEVVDCKENEDGSWTLTVDAVFKEAGKDCSFRHEVKMEQKPDDGWIYCGNEINRDGTYRVPQYRARREYK